MGLPLSEHLTMSENGHGFAIRLNPWWGYRLWLSLSILDMAILFNSCRSLRLCPGAGLPTSLSFLIEPLPSGGSAAHAVFASAMFVAFPGTSVLTRSQSHKFLADVAECG